MDEKVNIQDTGLGLNEFINTVTPEATETPEASQEVAPEVAPQPTDKVEPETKPEGTPAETKAEVTPAKEEKPSTDWENQAKSYEKRYYDTQKWATQVNAQNKELARQLEIINKKIDGTYDPETDEPKQVMDPNAIAYQAGVEGRISASRKMAYEKYGADVDSLLFAPDAPFKAIENNPLVQQRVLSSDVPVIEAIKVVKEKAFFDKYGYEPDAIYENIRKDVGEKVRQEVIKELAGKASLKDSQPVGIGQARTAVSGSQNSNSDGHRPLSEIFGGR
jgi:hypothetical protein